MPTVYVLSKTKTKNITTFHLIIIIFTFVKNRCILIAWAGFQNGLMLALNREPFAPFLLKPTIQTNLFIKNRWYTCLKYDKKMRHAYLIEFMGSFLLHSELQTHTICRTQFLRILLHAVHIRFYSPYTTEFIFQPKVRLITSFKCIRLQIPLIYIIALGHN